MSILKFRVSSLEFLVSGVKFIVAAEKTLCFQPWKFPADTFQAARHGFLPSALSFQLRKVNRYPLSAIV
jgi:hypothetical protein